MATFPRVSSAAVSLDLLFDEVVATLPPRMDGERDNNDGEIVELERERDGLRKQRAELASQLAKLDGDIEAAEQLIDELLTDGYTATLMAQERAENRARME